MKWTKQARSDYFYNDNNWEVTDDLNTIRIKKLKNTDIIKAEYKNDIGWRYNTNMDWSTMGTYVWGTAGWQYLQNNNDRDNALKKYLKDE